ncbi:MAG: B12-binding domain-containing radical SAM protein [Oscillospiraceae bacterium]|nr:B12-binding domain-containing radical SAM protein [Oscillospiraceae bacterium]
MTYEGSIYRPPSEAYSLIIQVTIGCSHNECTFCEAFKAKKFRVRPFESVLEDLREARRYYRHVERIFFADGDAMCLSTEALLCLLGAVKDIFPECSRVGVYSRATQILNKSMQDLMRLQQAGLGIVYIGAESGSNEVLKRVKKGETAEDIIKAVQKAESAAIKTSVTFVLGLGSKELMAEHAVKTGEMISKMGASYVGLLTLILTPEAPLYADAQSGDFLLISPGESIDELEIILEHTNCFKQTVLRSNHASNWLALKGTLPQDRDRMLGEIRAAKADVSKLRSGFMRGL